jgi:hypothetical protein
VFSTSPRPSYWAARRSRRPAATNPASKLTIDDVVDDSIVREIETDSSSISIAEERRQTVDSTQLPAAKVMDYTFTDEVFKERK